MNAAEGAEIKLTTPYHPMMWEECLPSLCNVHQNLCEERKTTDFEEVFGIKYFAGPSDGSHILSISLFCEGAAGSTSELSEASLREPELFGISTRFNPWAHYISPILVGAPLLRKKYPWIKIRIYLAGNMEFLVSLLSKDCEVALMNSFAPSSGPATLWRYLALEESNCKAVTVLDADLFDSCCIKLAITERLHLAGMQSWRVPVVQDFCNGVMSYRPMAAGFFGSIRNFPITFLLNHFLDQLSSGKLSTKAAHPHTLEKFPVYGSRWPHYGIDEFFLLTSLFPEVVKYPTLSMLPNAKRSIYLPMDIAYTIKGNSCSYLNHRHAGLICRNLISRPPAEAYSPETYI